MVLSYVLVLAFLSTCAAVDVNDLYIRSEFLSNLTAEELSAYLKIENNTFMDEIAKLKAYARAEPRSLYKKIGAMWQMMTFDLSHDLREFVRNTDRSAKSFQSSVNINAKDASEKIGTLSADIYGVYAKLNKYDKAALKEYIPRMARVLEEKQVEKVFERMAQLA